MTNDETTSPGSFSDGFAVPEDSEDNFDREEAAFAVAKISLIDDLVRTKTITPQYARLLEDIHTSTFGCERATLRKVRAAITLREVLEQEKIAKRRTTYIGSDIDWQFPAALGARNIVLMDPGLASPEHLSDLLESVKRFDNQAAFQADDPTRLSFNLDLGDGVERVDLNVSTDDILAHQPTEPIDCAIEFAGPSKSFSRSRVPVISNIAQSMENGGLVLNFDYIHDALYTPEIGMDAIRRDDFYVYKVNNHDTMLAATKIDFTAPTSHF